MNREYLESTIKQFQYYKMLGDKTIAVLSEEELQWTYNSESNSIAIIVKHISGNMISRWTEFLTSDGEKEWRNRDAEFSDPLTSKESTIEKWNNAWKCLFIALDQVDESNWNKLIYIRNMGHTIPEAMNRQLAHYAYHIGQIVFIGRMIKGPEWKSLSIPKNESKNYNNDKFSEAKRRQHFTDEFLQ